MMFGKLKARKKEGAVGGASSTTARLSRYNSAVHRDSLTRDPREEAGGEYDDESPTRLDSARSGKSSARSGKSSKIGGSSSNRKTSTQNSSVKLPPPARCPRMEMAAEMAMYDGGEEEAKLHYSHTTRPVASGGVNDHLSASLPRTRGVGNSPLPSAISSSAPPIMGGRNHMSALLADPEIEDFCDETRARINAGEASALTLAKYAQNENMRSRRNDSNHYDRKASEREDPFRPGSANGDKDKAKRRSSKRSDHSTKRNGDKKKAGRRLSQQENFLSSLEDCVEGMGFDPVDIKKAIESTDSKSSADVTKVVEWLAEHHNELRGINIKNDDEDIKDDSVGPQSAWSQGTGCSAKSMATTLTADSDQWIQEVEESLQELGFTHEDIRQKRELFRQHSGKMTVEKFISAMMEVEAEDSSSSSDDSSMDEKRASPGLSQGKRCSRKHEQKHNNGEHRSNFVTCRTQTSGANASISDIAEVNEKELANSLRDLGCRPDFVEEGRKMYRRYSDAVRPEEFISLMLDVEGDGRPPSLRQGRRKTAEVFESHENTAALGSIEIAPGQYATMLKGNQTWIAVQNGTAMSSFCNVCSVTLQCCPEADHVLCAGCNTVYPLDFGGNRRASETKNSQGQGRRLLVGMGFMKNK